MYLHHGTQGSSPSGFVYGASPDRMSSSSSDMSDTCTIPSTQTSFSSVSDFDDCLASRYSNYKPALPTIPTLPPIILSTQLPPASLAPPSETTRRRTANLHRSRTLPQLVRQSDRKVLFVESLVESATLIVEAIWPASAATPCQYSSKSPLKLRTFIEETLRRSRTSYSTLQVAMYYLILIKSHVPRCDKDKEQALDSSSRALQCGRRMFLVALILASKYLQDRNYSAKAWSKMSGLPTSEINKNEIAFLQAINWKLHISEGRFTRWTTFSLNYPPPPSSPGPVSAERKAAILKWQSRILELDIDIINVDLYPKISSLSNMVSSPHVLVATNRRSPTMRTGTASPVYPMRVPSIQRHATFPMTSYGNAAPAVSPMHGEFASLVSAPRSAMGFVLDHGNISFNARNLENKSQSSLSPFGPVRRPSLLASTTSSPDSMVSDDSRSSSVMSVASGPIEMPMSTTTTLPYPWALARSQTALNRPNNYNLAQIYEHATPALESDNVDFGCPKSRSPIGMDAAESAARILQEMHLPLPQNSSSVKNKRSFSVMSLDENPLQENVRSILMAGVQSASLPLTPPDSYCGPSKRARLNPSSYDFHLNSYNLSFAS